MLLTSRMLAYLLLHPRNTTLCVDLNSTKITLDGMLSSIITHALYGGKAAGRTTIILALPFSKSFMHDKLLAGTDKLM